MSMEPEGWHMDAGSPSWDAVANTFSFFLRKPGRERVLCTLALDALEKAVQSSGLSEPALVRIFDAHRQMIGAPSRSEAERRTARFRPLRSDRRGRYLIRWIDAVSCTFP